MQPRPFQYNTIIGLLNAWDRGQDTLTVLPTGAGKTNVFLWALNQFGYDGRTLVVAHRKELIDQAADRSRQLGLMTPGYVQGGRNDTGSQFTVATMQTLSKPGRFVEYVARGPIKIAVIDEAHRAMSRSYRRLIHMLRRSNPKVILAMFTATPNRTDGLPLWWLADEVVGNMSTNDMIDLGYLVYPRTASFAIDASIRGVTVRAGDVAAGETGRILNTPRVNEQIYRAWWASARSRPTIGFTNTVAHAEALARHFRYRGVAAAAMSHQTKWSEEALWDEGGMLTAFKTGRLQVLFNAYKLIEGVDIPSASCIIWARPTISKLVFAQGVGRGLRPYPDKRDCLVLIPRPDSDLPLITTDDVLDGWPHPLSGTSEPKKYKFALPKIPIHRDFPVY